MESFEQGVEEGWSESCGSSASGLLAYRCAGLASGMAGVSCGCQASMSRAADAGGLLAALACGRD